MRGNSILIKTLILAIMVNFSVFIISPVLAAPTATLKTNTIEATEKRCINLQEKITKKVSKFDSTKARHAAAYDNLVKRLNKIITTAEEAEVDTTDLKKHVTSLEKLIVTFKNDYTSYVTRLKAIPADSCDKKNKTALKASKDALTKVRTDSQNIKKLYKELIKPAVQSIKSVMQQQV